MNRCTIPLRTILTAAIVAACGGVEGGGDGGGSSTSGAIEATTSSSDTSSSSGEGSGGSSGSEGADSSTGTIPDLPPHPTACDAPEALIDVTVAATPYGPMTVDEAWLWFDYCGAGPFVVLAQRPTLEGGEAMQVEIELQADFAPTPWLGTYPAAVKWERDATGTMELLAPFEDPGEPGTPHPDLHLHARIEIDGGGYEVSGEVDLIDCGVADCSCPCE